LNKRSKKYNTEKDYSLLEEKQPQIQQYLDDLNRFGEIAKLISEIDLDKENK